MLVISFNPHNKHLSRYYYPHLTDMDTEAHRGRLAQSHGVDHSGALVKISELQRLFIYPLYNYDFSVCLFVCLFFFGCVMQHPGSVPQPGIKPMPPALKVRSPNHWTAREFP